MRSLNIIGAGKLGRTLGRLWHQQGFFQIQSICNRSEQSAREACEFIGAGQACQAIEEMADADCWMIATGDREISEIAPKLPLHRSGTEKTPLVFHCSGALGSEVLSPCRPAALASAHPVHSFADPERSLSTLTGSTVALEGDESAVKTLSSAFNAIGCELLTLCAEKKPLYHAGSVFACNYLTGLVDLSLQCFEAAGVSRKQALTLLKPIVLQTAENNMILGPEKSLTGPIARGDVETVARQLSAVAHTDRQLAQCYRQLGLACVKLAQRNQLPQEIVDRLNELLNEPNQ